MRLQTVSQRLSAAVSYWIQTCKQDWQACFSLQCNVFLTVMTTHTHSFLEPAATGSPISDRTQLSSWPASNRTFALPTYTWTAFFVACVKQSIYTAYMHMDGFLCSLYQTEHLHCLHAHGWLSLRPVSNRTFPQLSLWPVSNRTHVSVACSKWNTFTAFFESCTKQNIYTAFFEA